MEEEIGVPQESLYQRLKRESEVRRAAAPAPASPAPAPTPEADPDELDFNAFRERLAAKTPAPVPEQQLFQERALADDLQENPQQGPMPSGEVTAPTSAGLPEFRMDIYDGMDPEDAEALHQAYVKHRDTTDESALGGLLGAEPTYKGQRVYSPEETKGLREVEAAEKQGAENAARIRDVVGVGIHNALQNTEELGVSAAEKIAETVTGSDYSWTEDYNKAFPEMKTKKAEDQWYADAAAMGVGAVAGTVGTGGTGLALKAGQIGAKASPFISKIAEWMVRSVGTSAGTAATYDKDQENLLYGPGGWLADLSPKTTDAKTAENTLKKRFNVLLDSTLMAGGVDFALGAGKIGLKLFGDRVVRPAFGMVNQGIREKMIMDNLMKYVYQVTDATTPKQMAKIKNELTMLLKDKDNFEAFYNLDELGAAQYKRDTVSTLERGYEKILRNLPDTPEGKAEAERIGNLLGRMQSTRKSVMPEGSKTHTALGRPQHELEKALGTARQRGDEFTPDAARQVQTEAVRQADEATVPMRTAEYQTEQLINARPGIVSKGEMGQELTSGLGAKGQLLEREAATEDVLKGIESGREAVEGTKNDLFDNIRQTRGFEMDQESFRSAMQAADKYLPKTVKDIIQKANGNFGEIYTQIRVPLQKAIDRASKLGTDQDAVDSLLAFKKNLLEEQPAFMKQLMETTTDPIQAQNLKTSLKLLENAENYFKTEVTPYRAGIPGDLADIAEKHGKFNTPKVAVEQKEALQDALGSEHKDMIKHVFDIAKKPENAGKGIEESLGAMVKHNIARKISDALNTKGLDMLDASTIRAASREFDQVLEYFPGLEKELQEFQSELLQNRTTLKSLKEQINGPLKKQMENKQDEIYGSVFNDFFDKNRVPGVDSWESFKSLLNDKNAIGDLGEGKFDKVLKAIGKGDPMLEQGVKAAWARNLGDKIKVDGDISPAALREVLTGNSPILKQAEKLYNKDFAENLSRVLEEVRNAEEGVRVAGIGATEHGFGEKVVKSAVQKGINIYYGRLSRKGAQVSSIMSAIIDQMDTAEMRNTVLQRIFENPDEFQKLLHKASIKDNSLVKQAYRQWLYGLPRAPEDSDKKRLLDKQTREAFQ